VTGANKSGRMETEREREREREKSQMDLNDMDGCRD
jgi:hypothetical protein